jgi:hypothetical protein
VSINGTKYKRSDYPESDGMRFSCIPENAIIEIYGIDNGIACNSQDDPEKTNRINACAP